MKKKWYSIPRSFESRGLRKSALLGLSASVLLVVGSCSLKDQRFSRSFFRMDTMVEVTLVGSKSSVSSTWNQVDSLLADWEERFSQTKPRSEVLAVNNATGPVELSPPMAEMVREALEYGALLDGGFDLTILPIKELWGFGESSKAEEIPSPEALKAALEKVNYRFLRLEGNTLHRERPDVQIDLGGVAKGFALREVSRMLDSQGYSAYLIAAGDVVSKGRRPDGTPWKVGIKHPRQSDTLLATVQMDDGSLFTSGDYERFWMKDGVRYHHIFDPRTGHSCRTNQSLTIWSKNPIEAKFLSTGLFCRTKEQIAQFLSQRNGVEFVVVDSAGVVTASSGWGDRFQRVSP